MDTKLAQMVRVKRSIERLSQRELADMIGVGRKTVLRVENGRQLTTLAAEKFEKWLGITAERIVQLAKEPAKTPVKESA